MAWEAGGYDPGRFEVHVIGERVVGAPDGYPGPMSSASPAGSRSMRTPGV
ncbi:hypothetical protein [Amycolatopsis sp. CB00013]|nr:hypothetical protein [Amycolatopsis sp. CB00013]